MIPDATIREGMCRRMSIPPILKHAGAYTSQANPDSTPDLIGKLVRWLMPVTSAFWRPKQEKCKFKASEGLISNPRTPHID